MSLPDTYLFVEEKHDSFALNHEDGAEGAALKLLEERQNDGYWYYNKDAQKAESILEAQNAKDALTFLLSRSDYEYECVEVKYN